MISHLTLVHSSKYDRAYNCERAIITPPPKLRMFMIRIFFSVWYTPSMELTTRGEARSLMYVGRENDQRWEKIVVRRCSHGNDAWVIPLSNRLRLILWLIENVSRDGRHDSAEKIISNQNCNNMVEESHGCFRFKWPLTLYPVLDLQAYTQPNTLSSSGSERFKLHSKMVSLTLSGLTG